MSAVEQRLTAVTADDARVRQLWRLSGVGPVTAWVLRATLIELAHRLCRWDPRWREMKRRLRASGKPGSVAAAAVANRWVRQLYYEMIRPPPDEREKNLTGKEKKRQRQKHRDY